MHLKTIEKQDKIKPKCSWYQEVIIKIRTETNEIKTKRAINKISNQITVSFKKLTRLTNS